jgi:hypothetical protein
LEYRWQWGTKEGREAVNIRVVLKIEGLQIREEAEFCGQTRYLVGVERQAGKGCQIANLGRKGSELVVRQVESIKGDKAADLSRENAEEVFIQV